MSEHSAAVSGLCGLKHIVVANAGATTGSFLLQDVRTVWFKHCRCVSCTLDEVCSQYLISNVLPLSVTVQPKHQPLTLPGLLLQISLQILLFLCSCRHSVILTICFYMCCVHSRSAYLRICVLLLKAAWTVGQRQLGVRRDLAVISAVKHEGEKPSPLLNLHGAEWQRLSLQHASANLWDKFNHRSCIQLHRCTSMPLLVLL